MREKGMTEEEKGQQKTPYTPEVRREMYYKMAEDKEKKELEHLLTKEGKL